MKIDPDYLTKTLIDLVSINSINPSLVADGNGEAEIGAYAAQAMQALGLEVSLDEVAPGRVNAVGVRRGSVAGAPSLLWNAHMDTVGINGMERPFSPEIRQGRLYGRGSQDMKGSIAAMLAAVKALNEARITLGGNLIIALVADEEYGSLGMEDVVRRYHADAAIVTEPTDLELALAHRGFIGFEVETIGRAAHGSRYQEGIDAILHMGRFLHELAHLEQELRQREPHPLVGTPSLHTSIIRGGTEMSTYPAQCYLMIERRTNPGETVAQAEQEIQALLDRCAKDIPDFQGRLKTFMHRPPFEVSPQSPIAQVAAQVMQKHLQHPIHPRGASFWTDAAILAEAGVPSILLGPHGYGLHSAEEWVELDSCVKLAQILADIAIQFCAAI
jgi:acetylornithine deacetylase